MIARGLNFSLAPSGTKIDVENVMPLVNSGAIVIARGARAIDAFVKPAKEKIFSLIDEAVGEDTAARVRKVGLSKIHEHLTVPQMMAMHERASKELEPHFLRAMEQFVSDDLGQADAFFHRYLVMRFYLPNDLLARHYTELKSRPGKLVQHGPHHDYWQNVPLNATNIWIALEDVQAANGMIIYPDRFGHVLPRGGEHVRDDQLLGRPLRLPCKAGDIILFHSQHLHGGVLNRTHLTRVALTSRFCVGPPDYPRLGGQIPYATAAAVRSGDAGQLKRSFLRQLLHPRNLIKRLESRAVGARPGDDERRWKGLDLFLGRVGGMRQTDFGLGAGNAELDPAIHIVSKGRIAVTDSRGKRHQLRRRCPHMGADLACGHVENDVLWCPWHDMGFDVQSGEPIGSCSGISGIAPKQDSASRRS